MQIKFDLDPWLIYEITQALAKFAQIIYASKDLVKDESLAQDGLTKLKAAFEVWTTNRNKYPLVYESTCVSDIIFGLLLTSIRSMGWHRVDGRLCNWRFWSGFR